jgi:hypothetical protein
VPSWPTSAPDAPPNYGTVAINGPIELHRRITCGFRNRANCRATHAAGRQKPQRTATIETALTRPHHQFNGQVTRAKHIYVRVLHVQQAAPDRKVAAGSPLGSVLKVAQGIFVEF